MKQRRQAGLYRDLLVPAAVLIFFLFAAINAYAVSPEEALVKLQEGNKRYVAGKAVHPNQTQALRKASAGGQQPFASILSCSDSRAPVELIFDQGIGDVFVIRVAGNVIDTMEIGTLEYGVAHLATPLIVVLGHTHCGAVSAAVNNYAVEGSIVPLVEKIQPAVYRAKKTDPALAGSGLVTKATEENVWQSIKDLLSRSPIVRERMKAGKLQVIGAIYDIETGAIKWLGPYPEQAQLLSPSLKKLE